VLQDVFEVANRHLYGFGFGFVTRCNIRPLAVWDGVFPIKFVTAVAIVTQADEKRPKIKTESGFFSIGFLLDGFRKIYNDCWSCRPRCLLPLKPEFL